MTADLEPMRGVHATGRTAREPVAPNEPAAGPRTARPSPRAYRAPRLVAYGCLTDVTRFGGSEMVDSGSTGLGPMP